MTTQDAALAAARLGLGARPGDLATIARDPRGWALAQIRPEALAAPTLAARGTATDRARAFLERQRRGDDGQVENFIRETSVPTFREDLTAWLSHMVATPNGFAERWLQFWANHFTISVKRFVVLNDAIPFEVEALRPHVFGPFDELLIAVTSHQGMTFYLDNVVSMGPRSLAARLGRRGLNENLGREILELHTLGVEGGYSQADVRALALLLTGWTIQPPQFGGEVGAARFQPAAHEPGEKTLLGTTYPQGRAGGQRALRDLARHPATARHIATKLARHFIADDPPAAAIADLEGVFRTCGGDLASVARALVARPEVWEPPLTKARTPLDLVLATLRLFAVTGGPGLEAGLASLRTFDQIPYSAPSPKGWSDEARAWVGPDALRQRIDWALQVARLIPDRVQAEQVLAQAVGPLVSDATRRAIAGAPSHEQALALALLSPEFQRR